MVASDDERFPPEHVMIEIAIGLVRSIFPDVVWIRNGQRIEFYLDPGHPRDLGPEIPLAVLETRTGKLSVAKPDNLYHRVVIENDVELRDLYSELKTSLGRKE